MNVQVGSIGLIAAASSLLSPRVGKVIEEPGVPAKLQAGVIAALVGAVVLVAALKKKRIL